jgi:hypothetical protein
MGKYILIVRNGKIANAVEIYYFEENIMRIHKKSPAELSISARLRTLIY